MNRLTLLACLGFVSAVSSNPLGADHDICSTAGKLCGKADCVAHQNPEFFTCQCGKDQYFNATAQRCYHIKSCFLYPCTAGSCNDNDGNTERTCECLNFENMLPDCSLNNDFNMACGRAGGDVIVTNRGVTCSCPYGMKWEGNMCKSVVCINQYETCRRICHGKRLLEDTRCCQGWDQASCYANHDEDTYCKPGTISTGYHLNCINVCAAKESACEYMCNYTDEKSPEYTCVCPPGQELEMDGRTCSVKSHCNRDEEKRCEEMEKKCVFEEGKAKCICPDYEIELGNTCSATCTAGKTKECAGMLSACKIVDSVQTCTCEQPLTWDDAKKVCVLEKQFRYVFTFKNHQYTKLDWCSDWRRDEEAEVIDVAMKNLYGKELFATRLIKCGEERNVELTFRAEPLPPALNRIHQCENKREASCLFAPHLRIIEGSVSGPTAVDLCAEFFAKIPAIKENHLECRKGEGGQYSLRCAQKSSTPPENYGALTVQQCNVGTHCSAYEEERCNALGKECVLEERKAICKCSEDKIELGGTCTASCTHEKRKECAGMQSACKIVGNAQTCVCEEPLTWDEAKKVCHQVRTDCNVGEERLCSALGKKCVFEDRKPKCKCSDDKIELDGTCQDKPKSGSTTASVTTALLFGALVPALMA